MKKIEKPCLIVTGGTVEPELLQQTLRDKNGDCFIIGVDKGLEILEQLKIEPDLVIGDFDSADNGIRAKYVTSPDAIVRDDCIILQPEKDYTDTHVAVSEAINRGAETIILLGATGTRLDHTLANLGLLFVCESAGVHAEILDMHNRITLIQREATLYKDKLYGPFVSLVPATQCVRDITLKGFKYNACNLSIKQGETIGISNELREEEGHITIGDGCLYIMETKD